mgnify:CR=1 FL=1
MKIEAIPLTGIVMTLTLTEEEINTLYTITEYTEEIVEDFGNRRAFDNEDFTEVKVRAILIAINKAMREI